MVVYDLVWRTRIVRYYQESKKSMRVVGKIFSVGKSSISRWLSGIDHKTEDKRGTRKNDKESKDLEEKVGRIIGDNWVGRVRDVKDILEKDHKVQKSTSTIWRVMDKIGYSYKQVRKRVETDKNTLEIKESYKKEIKEAGYEKVLCLDELGFQLGMDPKKGWSKKGTRCIIKNKKGGRTNYTGCFVISSSGIESCKIKKGSMKGEDLLGFLEMGLKDKTDGKMLVLDNARTHHTKDVKERIKDLGMEGKWLPPYSPELNPIEEVFGWLKNRLRRMRVGNEKDLREGIKKLELELKEIGVLERYKHSYD